MDVHKVGGKTFEIKDLLKSYGAYWKPIEKQWWIPKDRITESDLLTILPKESYLLETEYHVVREHTFNNIDYLKSIRGIWDPILRAWKVPKSIIAEDVLINNLATQDLLRETRERKIDKEESFREVYKEKFEPIYNKIWNEEQSLPNFQISRRQLFPITQTMVYQPLPKFVICSCRTGSLEENILKVFGSFENFILTTRRVPKREFCYDLLPDVHDFRVRPGAIKLSAICNYCRHVCCEKATFHVSVQGLNDIVWKVMCPDHGEIEFWKTSYYCD